MKRKSLPTGRDFLFVEGYGNENPGAFQSTRPLRGATARRWTLSATATYFNPRAPCGARRSMRAIFGWKRGEFQPTRPLRGATVDDPDGAVTIYISTHAPLAGRDREEAKKALEGKRFQPTRPLRGATLS